MKFVKESIRKNRIPKGIKESLSPYKDDLISQRIYEYLGTLDLFLFTLECYIEERNELLNDDSNQNNLDNNTQIGEYLIDALKSKELIMNNYQRFLGLNTTTKF
ncbi:MAG: hypothetical protein IJX00_01930 [Clostridia bacterium]|nr:hypothetical protein [Clostridia bacterium]